MKKRQHALLMLTAAIAVCLIFAACADKAATSQVGETSETEDSSEVLSDSLFSFAPNGVKIELGADIAPALEKLGEAKNVFEAPSCAFDGEDRMYYYSGYTITTYPDGDKDRILSVMFDDDTAETGEGVYLGMSESEIEEIYGEGDKSQDGSIISYFSGDNELRIFFEGGNAAEIAIFYLPVQKTYDDAQS